VIALAKRLVAKYAPAGPKRSAIDRENQFLLLIGGAGDGAISM